jgi:hypothetical protein
MSNPRDAVQLQDLLRTLSGAGGHMHSGDAYDPDEYEDFDDFEEYEDDELELEPLPPIGLPPESELAEQAARTLSELGRAGCVELVGEELGGELWQQYSEAGEADALSAWGELVSEYLEYAGDTVSASDEPDPHQLVDELMLISLPLLYAGHGMSRDRKVSLVARIREEDASDVVDAYLDPLMAVGFLDRQDDTITMTALGKWGYRRIRLADGGLAPLLDELGEYPAPNLLWSLPNLSRERAAEAADRWVASRETALAAEELLEAASTYGSYIRGRAVRLVEQLPDHVADEAFTAYADDPLVGPYALVRRLRQAGSGEPLPLEASRALAVDTLLVSLEDRFLIDNTRDVPDEVWEHAKPLLDRTAPWPVRHPQAEEAYELIAELHPHGKTRKLAKKALHQIQNPKED